MSSTISSPRDDAWMGLALEELLDGLQMGHRPQPSLLAPLRVAGGRRQIPSAEQLDVPPDHRFGPIRVDTTPPRPRPTEAAHTPADQGKQPLADQGPPLLVPLRAATTQSPATQATQKQATGGKPSPRAAPRVVGSSTRPHTGRVSTTPTGNQGQPPREAPRSQIGHCGPGRHDNYRTRNPIIKGGAASCHHFGTLTHRPDSNNAWDTRSPGHSTAGPVRGCSGTRSRRRGGSGATRVPRRPSGDPTCWRRWPTG
ncbi:hypothetical protein KR059_012933 [Drosophila kikkawai]|nr:hypothetical protein KR059_012933 [Drosophila kikkawai]